MAFSAQAVANEFIDIAGNDQLTPMKLQKLVYFAHGWHLAIEDAPLVQQPFEAWQFGPVIPELYKELREYGADKVTDYARKYSLLTRRWVVPRIPHDAANTAAQTARSLVQDVWGVYGGYSAIKLSNATHKDGTPWANCYTPNRQHIVIPDDEIKRYFNDLLIESGGTVGVQAHT